ncbi:hypothetical protein ACF0H5_022362 [Mactra antiquata]
MKLSFIVLLAMSVAMIAGKDLDSGKHKNRRLAFPDETQIFKLEDGKMHQVDLDSLPAKMVEEFARRDFDLPDAPPDDDPHGSQL